MRRTAPEKMETLRLVEASDLKLRATLRQLGIPRSTFYGWYRRHLASGFDGCTKPAGRACWNAIPGTVQKQGFDLDRTDLSPRGLSCLYADEKRYPG